MKLRLFVLLASLYMLGASREPPWGDAHVVYATTQNLVDNFRIDVNLPGPPQFYAVRDGKRYGVFPLGNVVAMAPGYLAYRLLSGIPKAPTDLLYRYTCHLSPSLLIAGACALFLSLARRQGASARAAFWLAFALGTSTILVIYARSPFSEALQTLAFTWVLERGLTVGDRLTTRGACFGGVACGLLLNTKLVYALCLPIVPLYWIVRHRRAGGRLVVALAAAAGPVILLAGFAVAHNWYKTRTLLDTGYHIPDGVFSGNLYAGLDGFFLSPGKSIFLYSPPLLLGLAALPSYLRAHRPRALFLLALTGVMTLANAKFRYWHADYCWGPRLLVPMTPAFLLPAAPWIEGALARGRPWARSLAVGALVGIGLWVQVLGASFYWDHYIRMAIAVKDQTGASGWYGEDLHHCHFIPQFSPILGHAWLLGHWYRGDDDLTADTPWKRVLTTAEGKPIAKVSLGQEWSGTLLDFWAPDWFRKPLPHPVPGGEPPGAPPWGYAIGGVFGSAALWAAASLALRRRRGLE